MIKPPTSPVKRLPGPTSEGNVDVVLLELAARSATIITNQRLSSRSDNDRKYFHQHRD